MGDQMLKRGLVLTLVVMGVVLPTTVGPGPVSAQDMQTIGIVEELAPPDGARGYDFGHAVAIDGDTVAVGMPGGYSEHLDKERVGAVHVYTVSDGTFRHVARLNAAGTNIHECCYERESARLGHVVDMDGDTIVAGAAGGGAVYVFTGEREGGFSNAAAARLVPPDGAYIREFGSSVAVDGDTVVVGSGATRAAHVYTRPDGGWVDSSTAIKLTSPDGLEGSYGISVDMEGDTIVLGDPVGHGNEPYTGAAFVFTRSEEGWVKTAKLTAPDGRRGDRFGTSVSLDENALVVGTEEGAAYLFVKPSRGWVWASSSEGIRLASPDPKPLDTFGDKVVVRGGTILVGTGWPTGVSYMFTIREDGSIGRPSRITPRGNGADESFGQAFDLMGDLAVIGSPKASKGIAHLVRIGTAPDLDATASVEPRLTAADSTVMHTVKVTNMGPGDSRDVIVTYDLHRDLEIVAMDASQGVCTVTAAAECNLGALAVGSDATVAATVYVTPRAANNVSIEATVYGVEGDLNLRNNSAVAIIVAVDPLARLLSSVNYRGSIAFDGETSMAGTAYEWTPTHDDWGRVKLNSPPISRSSSYNNSRPGVDDRRSSFSPNVLAIDGDTLVVGIPSNVSRSECVWEEARCSDENQGLVRVFVRSGDVWEFAAELTAEDGFVTDRFGEAVAVDGGLIAVGAPTQDVKGSVYVFARPRDGTWRSTSSALKLRPPYPGQTRGFGRDVDVDGDTVVVGGASARPPGGIFSHDAYVFTVAQSESSESGLGVSRTFRFWLPPPPGSGNCRRFGASVSIDAGTIAVGAPGDEGCSEMGTSSAYVLVKTMGGWGSGVSVSKLVAEDDVDVHFGHSVSVSDGAVAVGSSRGVYLFIRPEGGWKSSSKATKIVAPDTYDIDTPPRDYDQRHHVVLHGNMLAVQAGEGLHMFALDRIPEPAIPLTKGTDDLPESLTSPAGLIEDRIVEAPSGGGCGLSTHTADLSVVGLMAGIVWGALRRRSAGPPESSGMQRHMDQER